MTVKQLLCWWGKTRWTESFSLPKSNTAGNLGRRRSVGRAAMASAKIDLLGSQNSQWGVWSGCEAKKKRQHRFRKCRHDSRNPHQCERETRACKDSMAFKIGQPTKFVHLLQLLHFWAADARPPCTSGICQKMLGRRAQVGFAKKSTLSLQQLPGE